MTRATASAIIGRMRCERVTIEINGKTITGIVCRTKRRRARHCPSGSERLPFAGAERQLGYEPLRADDAEPFALEAPEKF